MEAVQVNNISAQEFRKVIAEMAKEVATSVVDAMLAKKPDPNEDVTITAIAESWGVKKQTVRGRITAHNIPFVKLGREIAIKRKWLDTIKNPVPKDL